MASSPPAAAAGSRTSKPTKITPYSRRYREQPDCCELQSNHFPSFQGRTPRADLKRSETSIIIATKTTFSAPTAGSPTSKPLALKPFPHHHHPQEPNLGEIQSNHFHSSHERREMSQGKNMFDGLGELAAAAMDDVAANIGGIGEDEDGSGANAQDGNDAGTVSNDGGIGDGADCRACQRGATTMNGKDTTGGVVSPPHDVAKTTGPRRDSNDGMEVLNGGVIRGNGDGKGMAVQTGIIVIQARVRGAKARLSLHRMKKAALLIQTSTRCLLERHGYLTLRKGIISLQARVRGIQARRNRTNANQAVLKLQSFARCCIAREQYRTFQSGIVVLQARVRGAKARLSWSRMKKAALRIQSFIRGLLQRNGHLTLMLGITYLQARVRGIQARKDRVNAAHAALKLQSFARSCITRRQYSTLRSGLVVLQARVRGTKARLSFSRTKKAAQILQSFTRGLLERNSYLTLKLGVAFLQARVRGIQARKDRINLKLITGAGASPAYAMDANDLSVKSASSQASCGGGDDFTDSCNKPHATVQKDTILADTGVTSDRANKEKMTDMPQQMKSSTKEAGQGKVVKANESSSSSGSDGYDGGNVTNLIQEYSTATDEEDTGGGRPVTNNDSNERSMNGGSIGNVDQKELDDGNNPTPPVPDQHVALSSKPEDGTDQVDGDGMATLAEAAAAGCRKCKKELENGEKTRRPHDQVCPQKYRSVGKPALKYAPRSEKEESVDENDESEGDEDSSCGPAASLAEAAAPGCRKCQKELETGLKTRKAHDEHCPRKRGGRSGSRTALKQATRSDSEDESDESDGEEDLVCVPEASLTEAAASGCRKCQKELASGEKTRYVHHDWHCPRKRGGRGSYRPPCKESATLKNGNGNPKADVSIHYQEDPNDHFVRRSARQTSVPKIIVEDDSNERNGRARKMWTAEEDRELVKRVRLHGEGKWKLILDNSRILRKRYEKTHSETNNAQYDLQHWRNQIKFRWRDKLKQKEADGEFSNINLDDEEERSDYDYDDSEDDADGNENEDQEDEEVEEDHRGSMFKKWTAQEDDELVKRVRLHGEGNWKDILDNSRILQERFKAAESVQHAGGSLRQHWRVLRARSETKDEVCPSKSQSNNKASLTEAAASGCRKCIKALEIGETRGGGMQHDVGCPRAGSSNGYIKKRNKKRAKTERVDVSHAHGSHRSSRKRSAPKLLGEEKSDVDVDEDDTEVIDSDEEESEESTEECIRKILMSQDNATRRSMRKKSAPELFVARPSKSGVGVKDGDEDFLATISAPNAYSSDEESDGSSGNDSNEDEIQERQSNRWTAKEDKELIKRVRLHGEGNWKDILDNSRILRERFKTAVSVKIARQCVAKHWSEVLLMTLGNDSTDTDDESDSELMACDDDSICEEEEEVERRQKKRKEWTTKEDEELIKRVRLHGEGNWKDIFDNSRILQERFADAESENNARCCIKSHWQEIKCPRAGSSSRYSNTQVKTKRAAVERDDRTTKPNTSNWTEEEDAELLHRVRLHGEGNWAVIWKNSSILQERYRSAKSVIIARQCITNRWLSKFMESWKEGIYNYSSDEESDGSSGNIGSEDEIQERQSNRWTAKEDKELIKRVRLHGEGNWKDILDNSRILQERFKMAESEKHARWSIRFHWRDRTKQLEKFLDDADDTGDESESEVMTIEEEDSCCEEDEGRERKRKPKEWTTKEDAELVKRVRLHGEGNWKGILDNSCILQKRFKEAESEKHARECIKQHWRHVLSKSTNDNANDLDDDYSNISFDEDAFSLSGESLMNFDTNVNEDDESTVSSMGSEVGSLVEATSGRVGDVPLSREDWNYAQGATRQDILKTICDNKISNNDLTVVQITKRGNTPRDSLKHLFLVVPDIISKGWHEGRVIPPDSLFTMLGVTGIVSVYAEDGRQVCDDRTSWDIYAASDRNSEVINYWAIDSTGKHVGKFEVPMIGGVLKWFNLLDHQERDRIERFKSLAVVQPSHRHLLPAHLYLVLEQMRLCQLIEYEETGSEGGIGSLGLECKHCSNHTDFTKRFKLFPVSEDELQKASEQIVSHVQDCEHCPFYVREELDALKRSSESLIYKKSRSLRSAKNEDTVESLMHEGTNDFFRQLLNRLNAPKNSQDHEEAPTNASASSLIAAAAMDDTSTSIGDNGNEDGGTGRPTQDGNGDSILSNYGGSCNGAYPGRECVPTTNDGDTSGGAESPPHDVAKTSCRSHDSNEGRHGDGTTNSNEKRYEDKSGLSALKKPSTSDEASLENVMGLQDSSTSSAISSTVDGNVIADDGEKLSAAIQKDASTVLQRKTEVGETSGIVQHKIMVETSQKQQESNTLQSELGVVDKEETPVKDTKKLISQQEERVTGAANKSKSPAEPSRYNGVYPVNSSNGRKFQAKFSKSYLGTYVLQADAALAYDQAVRAWRPKKHNSNVNFATQCSHIVAREEELKARGRGKGSVELDETLASICRNRLAAEARLQSTGKRKEPPLTSCPLPIAKKAAGTVSNKVKRTAMMFRGGEQQQQQQQQQQLQHQQAQIIPSPLSMDNSEDFTLVLSAVEEAHTNLCTLQPIVMALGDPGAMEEIAKAFKITASSSQFVLDSDLPSAYTALNEAWAKIKVLERCLAARRHQAPTLGGATGQLQQHVAVLTLMAQQANPAVMAATGQNPQNNLNPGALPPGMLPSNNVYAPTGMEKKSTKKGKSSSMDENIKASMDISKERTGMPLPSNAKSPAKKKRRTAEEANNSSPPSPPPEKAVELKDLLPQSMEDPEITWKRLQVMMEQSQMSQKQLQKTDERNGLPKSHLVNSCRSRKQLQNGKILKKWNGDPLIIAKEGEDEVKSSNAVPGISTRTEFLKLQLEQEQLRHREAMQMVQQTMAMTQGNATLFPRQQDQPFQQQMHPQQLQARNFIAGNLKLPGWKWPAC